MIMTHPPAFYPGNFLMKNMKSTNSGLMYLYVLKVLIRLTVVRSMHGLAVGLPYNMFNPRACCRALDVWYMILIHTGLTSKSFLIQIHSN